MAQVGLVVIEKEAYGEAFATTYALAYGDFPGTEPLTNTALMEMVGGAGSFSESQTTDPTAIGYDGVTSPLAALIGWDRFMTANDVIYKRAYISDGKTPETALGAFAVIPLGVSGILVGLPGGPAPLNVCLMIIRSPDGFSARAGRALLRCAVGRDEVQPSSGDGVTLTGGGRTARLAQLTAANAHPGFAEMLELYEPGTRLVSLVIPQYVTVEGPAQGMINGWTPIKTMTLGDAVSRQVKRGKKRPVPSP